MLLLRAQPVVEKIHQEISKGLEELRKRSLRMPKLAVVIVGEDPASLIYTKKKAETARTLGMLSETHSFPASASPDEVKARIEVLNRDSEVDGILLQRPLPGTFVEEEVVYWISPSKDVDAFHPENVGRLALGLPCLQPCTPSGVMELLHNYQVPLEGKIACVLGRSSIVGKPMGMLLLQANATVLQCHSKTKEVRAFSKQADILVVAAGKPRMVDASFVKHGAVVIDVGIHRDAAGKVHGDVDQASVEKTASALTPVPGGVGPLTIAMLMKNTLKSAKKTLDLASQLSLFLILSGAGAGLGTNVHAAGNSGGPRTFLSQRVNPIGAGFSSPSIGTALVTNPAGLIFNSEATVLLQASSPSRKLNPLNGGAGVYLKLDPIALGLDAFRGLNSSNSTQYRTGAALNLGFAQSALGISCSGASNRSSPFHCSDLGLLVNPYGSSRFGLTVFHALDKHVERQMGFGFSEELGAGVLGSLDGASTLSLKGLMIMPGLGYSLSSFYLTAAYGISLDSERQVILEEGSRLGLEYRLSRGTQLAVAVGQLKSFAALLKLSF